MTGPLVTVCLPTIGRADLFAQTWQSLQAQTLRDFEVLVLDNASDPASREAIAACCAGDARVRVLRLDTRVPVFGNFERGRQAARGRYLTYFHDDDVYGPTFLARHVGALEASPDSSFSGCNCSYIDAHGAALGGRDLIGTTGIWPGRYFIENLLRLGRNPAAFQSVMFRRAAVPDGLLTDAEGPHCTDFVMLMRLAERGSVSMIADRLLQVRIHAMQGSAIAASHGMPMMRGILLNYIADAERRGVTDRAGADRWRAALERVVRLGLVLGWFQAENREESVACVRHIDGGALWAIARSTLSLLDSTGVRSAVRASALPRLRRIVRKASL